MNLYQKLLEIQNSVLGLAKDTNGNSYSYVSGSKVLNHIKPLMCKHGLLLKQEVVSIDNERQNYTVGHGKPTQKIKEEILSKVMMRFTWVDCESGETDVSMFGANGQNDWDKGVGSALTYAERYFLLKYFHIATDEDDVDAKGEIEETPLDIAMATVRTLSTIDDLQAFWATNTQFHNDKAFKTAVTNRKKQITDNGTVH